MKKTKRVTIKESLNKPLIIDEDIAELMIEVFPQRVGHIYLKRIDNLKSVIIQVERAGELEFFTYLSGKELPFKIEAKVAENGKLSLFTLADSSPAFAAHISLAEEKASAEALNLFIYQRQTQISSDIVVFHRAKETSSQITSYAIAKDQAKISLNNNTTIEKGASGSSAKQTIKGLNLSPSGLITANPNLFIDENDVIAHHGATIGSLNKDDLFYLMSRGLSLAEAAKIIVLGFLQPLLDKIKDVELRAQIKSDFENLIE